LISTLTTSDSLFGYDHNGTQINLTKRWANEVLSAAWQHIEKPGLSGHSFRVGGASLQHAAGINIDQIKSLGRWTSGCYKVYIKTLSPEDLVNSLAVLEQPTL
jgi:hypothetical protein